MSRKQKRLLSAAKELADATAQMVEAAKMCASRPNDRESQDALKRAAEHLRSTTHAAVGTTIKRKVIKRLENAAKHAAATATQCIAASQGVGPHNTNVHSQVKSKKEMRNEMCDFSIIFFCFQRTS